MDNLLVPLLLFAALWVGGAICWAIMRSRVREAFDKGKSESASEAAALNERLCGRDAQAIELRTVIQDRSADRHRLWAYLRPPVGSRGFNGPAGGCPAVRRRPRGRDRSVEAEGGRTRPARRRPK